MFVLLRSTVLISPSLTSLPVSTHATSAVEELVSDVCASQLVMQDLSRRSQYLQRFISYVRSPLPEDDAAYSDDALLGGAVVSSSEPDLTIRR